MSALLALIIQETPGIIDFIKQQYAAAHPTEPEPTEEQIKAAWLQAAASSLLKDDNWLAVHGG